MSAYLVAILGTSPSLATELVWWLSQAERAPLAGLEVWTTTTGARLLRDVIASPAWAQLQERTGPLLEPEPDGTEPCSSFGFRIHVFTHEQLQLADVRSEAEALSVSAQLHDRVRTLRHELNDRIPIVASLAGGRKVVSAALQTAMSLQAGRRDRLVHVLLHDELEVWLRDSGHGREYLFPTEDWAKRSGIAVVDQLMVYDVPFPRLKYLVPRRLAEVLDTLPYDHVWPVLNQHLGSHVSATLRRSNGQWFFTIGEHYQTELRPPRVGALMAAMASMPSGANTKDVIDCLDSHALGWAPPNDRNDTEDTRQAAVRAAASVLRSRLSDIPIGLERFVPRSHQYHLEDVHVELDEPVVWES